MVVGSTNFVYSARCVSPTLQIPGRVYRTATGNGHHSTVGIITRRALTFVRREFDDPGEIMSAIKKFAPLLDRVLVERARTGAQKSAGGILLPESASKVRTRMLAGWLGGFLRSFSKEG